MLLPASACCMPAQVSRIRSSEGFHRKFERSPPPLLLEKLLCVLLPLMEKPYFLPIGRQKEIEYSTYYFYRPSFSTFFCHMTGRRVKAFSCTISAHVHRDL